MANSKKIVKDGKEALDLLVKALNSNDLTKEDEPVKQFVKRLNDIWQYKKL